MDKSSEHEQQDRNTSNLSVLREKNADSERQETVAELRMNLSMELDGRCSQLGGRYTLNIWKTPSFIASPNRLRMNHEDDHGTSSRFLGKSLDCGPKEQVVVVREALRRNAKEGDRCWRPR